MNSRSDTVMFVILLIASSFTQGHTIVSYGKEFITAFPENVGYFYPYSSSRGIRVTTLHSDTFFTVFYNGTQKTVTSLQQGETVFVSFPKTAEVHQLNCSRNTIRITSEKDIAVHSFSQTDIGTATTPEKSVQSHVVQPITNLGRSYLIPSLNHSDLVQTFSGTLATFRSQRYSSFKLIIINAEDAENTITIFKKISGSVQEEKIKISSYQLIQMQADASLIKVESSHKVAVILTHPCLEITTSCKCNMIVSQILPVRFQGQSFVVPYIPGITQSRLLMTSNVKSTSLSHNNVQLQPSPSGLLSLSDQTESQYVNASGNVSLILISPGLIIDVIPENMFAACYLLQFYSDIKKALVIAETGSKNNVHKQNIPVTNTQWTEITGTKYSSGIISLTESQTFIWHPSSKIAVYILENIDTAVYGGPATPINTQPDEFGCVVIPGQFEIRNEPLSWTESLAHCTSLQKHLACPTREDIQMDLVNTFNTTEGEEAWIGLRRSLMTTDWYWQRQTLSTTLSPSSSVEYVHWADGQPLVSFKGLCASLSLDQDDEFKWKTAKCCEKKRPVCYKPPIYLI
ncbi:uncharacterized protein LOC130432296 [Triplophysa dalaica]|uniref:uncharacterized protein LOC130432296 n=1 Tax=Triplophysa dalaica TaxID=1582913 RepID=UPI0024E02A8B|nr:uncharacterized protein LOC130432296 [Triplophysa dalaica]XP_056617578.1 uncharacterized protein LOC130432296 [Triplophysa dalaica]XP_056617579.1 uncharacterized protein LOC130432296 [Triplophysa dalaica]XP_056617580.1 uncharacterized protein LOC130432296 [Triplophysa dalaica]